MTPHEEIWKLIRKNAWFTPEERATFRDKIALTGFGDLASWGAIRARVSLESIESNERLMAAIDRLNESSSRLARTGNWLAVAAIVFAFVQVAVAVF